MSGIISDNVGRSSGLIKAATVSVDCVKLSEVSFTSGTPASITWVNGTDGVVIDSTYAHYIMMIDAVPSTAAAKGSIRLSDDTGSSYESDGYITRSWRSYYSGGEDGASATAYLIYAGGECHNTLATGMHSGSYTFHGMSDTANLTSCSVVTGNTNNPAEQLHANYGSGVRTAVGAHDGIQFLFHNGTIQHAKATLYGMK